MMAFHSTQAWLDGTDLVLEVTIYDDSIVFDELRLERRRADTPMLSRNRHVRYRLREGVRDTELTLIDGPPIELQQVHPGRIGRSRARVCWGSAAESTANCSTAFIASTSTVAWRPRGVVPTRRTSSRCSCRGRAMPTTTARYSCRRSPMRTTPR